MNPYSESYVCFDPTKITHPIKTNPVDEFHHYELARVMMQPERWHAGKRTLINLHVFKVQVNQPARCFGKGVVFCRYDPSRIMGSEVTRGNWRSPKINLQKKKQIHSPLLFGSGSNRWFLRAMKKMAIQYGPRPPTSQTHGLFNGGDWNCHSPSAFSRYVFVAGWVPVVSVMAVAMFSPACFNNPVGFKNGSVCGNYPQLQDMR